MLRRGFRHLPRFVRGHTAWGASAGSDGTFRLTKPAGEQLGIVLSEEGFLQQVEPGGVAQRAGAGRFLGRRVATVQGESVSSAREALEVYSSLPESSDVVFAMEDPWMAAVQEAFTEFDANGDGKLSKDELRKGMEISGRDLSDRELETMIGDADKDGDGYICMDEFAAQMTSSPSKSPSEAEVAAEMAVAEVAAQKAAATDDGAGEEDAAKESDAPAKGDGR
eukprot:Hpha_TRINITY_DN6613_c0_g1::TRINITY_DN6613_c0_g1_i1::g.26508::m.26508